MANKPPGLNSAFMTSLGTEDIELEIDQRTDSAFGRLQSSLTHIRDGMEKQNEVLHSLQGQLDLKSDELDNVDTLRRLEKPCDANNTGVTEHGPTLSHSEPTVRNSGLVEEMLQNADSLRSVLSSCPTSTNSQYAQSRTNTMQPTMLTYHPSTGNGREEPRTELENMGSFGSARCHDVNHQAEVEELKLKLKTATQICAQQEKHFSSLVKELEHRLCEAIADRDELLTLRQHESGTQQQLIKQLQAALQQAKQNLELKNKEFLDCQERNKSEHDKLSQVLSLLIKLHDVVKCEEDKRGRHNTLTTITCSEAYLTSGDMLLQVLSNCLTEDDTRINELIKRCHEVELQLMEAKESSEEEKLKLIKNFECKLEHAESEHGKALDIAANRTLTERDRIAELVHELEENRKNYEKVMTEKESVVAGLREEHKAIGLRLEEQSKANDIQRIKDATVIEEQQKRIEELQREKEEMLRTVMMKASCETVTTGKITTLEKQLDEAAKNARTLEESYLNKEKLHLEDITQLKEVLGDKTNEIQRLVKEHSEELKRKTNELLEIERDKAKEYVEQKNKHSETVRQLEALKEKLTHQTDKFLKCQVEYKTLEEQHKNSLQEKDDILSERDDLLTQVKSMSEKISKLREEKSSLSTMVRSNVHDLGRAKDVIDTLQANLDEREKRLDVFNKQDADLAELLLKKHLVGESLLDERQQIVEVLEEKIRAVDQLKEIRDALAYKLESKVQVLNEMESNCRSLQTKLDVRSNELEVIMDDRNKTVKELKLREEELGKMKEERDSLVTLMNGKDSEKEREVNKLISRLKGAQHDLDLTRKVLEGKREANSKAVQMTTVAQEEITSQRKEMDSMKDRIKWLQESLQATTEEKAYFEEKASELANDIESTNMENENLKTELDRFMRSYDEASGRIRQMEKALEKAGVKFAESQVLVERLEQDLAKIKLHHSLEVKDLQRKVKAVPANEPNVQVVQPLNMQKRSTALVRDHLLRTTKELNATQQRLIDEAEMTKGFKILLHDMRQLMSDIKESGGVSKKTSTASVEKSTSTVGNLHGALVNEGQYSHAVPRDETAGTEEEEPPRSNGVKTTESLSPHYRRAPGNKKPRSSQRKHVKVKPPLLSSSPKRFTSDRHHGDTEETGTTERTSVSDISDVESERSEGRPFGKDERVVNMYDNNKPRKDSAANLRNRVNTKHSTNSSVDQPDYDDVESLIMVDSQEEGSHKKAQKILDLLALKSQELTFGNQKIAELIGRQDDGIRRCREAEENIKKILK